jgi:phosphoribosylformimino-5-aminoimidazole carboxamide ribotide isomerase
MEIIPSIDLLGGRVVRLYQGDFQKETVYSEEATDIALKWEKSGASRIHIVDLDGAKNGAPANLNIVEEIAFHVSIPLQIGGGIRSLDTAQSLVALGIERIVLGTSAVRNPILVDEVCRSLGADSVVVGVDARNGLVALQGWVESTSIPAVQLMVEMSTFGVGRFVYTDIAQDGTLSGPNLTAIASLMKEIPSHIVASGGIGSMEDLEKLEALGVEAVIIGKALYTGAIDLQHAIRRFEG